MYLNISCDFAVKNAWCGIIGRGNPSQYDVLAEFGCVYGEITCATLPILPAVSSYLYSSVNHRDWLNG